MRKSSDPCACLYVCCKSHNYLMYTYIKMSIMFFADSDNESYDSSEEEEQKREQSAEL